MDFKYFAFISVAHTASSIFCTVQNMCAYRDGLGSSGEREMSQTFGCACKVWGIVSNQKLQDKEGVLQPQ